MNKLCCSLHCSAF